MKATLISWTTDPIHTLLEVWDASKTEKPLADVIEGVNLGIASEDRELYKLMERILDQDIPVAQFVSFNFVLEDVPISWREQAVRHRVGIRFGDNYAVDIIPEADLGFWSQSMRIQSMSEFFDKQQFYIPPAIGENDAALDVYVQAMADIQGAYDHLVDLGIEMEDARNLIPLGATHRISMNVNLQALKHIIGERGCWILQGSLWGPIITSMVEELATKVHPIFRRMIAPPCVRDGRFQACVYNEENWRRYDGRDKMAICPLWATEHGYWNALNTEQVEATAKRIPEYARLWGQPKLDAQWKWEDR